MWLSIFSVYIFFCCFSTGLLEREWGHEERDRIKYKWENARSSKRSFKKSSKMINSLIGYKCFWTSCNNWTHILYYWGGSAQKERSSYRTSQWLSRSSAKKRAYKRRYKECLREKSNPALVDCWIGHKVVVKTWKCVIRWDVKAKSGLAGDTFRGRLVHSQ